MSAGRLVCEAAGSAAPGATTRTFAVALASETDADWPVDAASAEEVIDIEHGTVPRAREVWRSELLVRAEDDDRNRDLPGVPFAALRPAGDRLVSPAGAIGRVALNPGLEAERA